MVTNRVDEQAIFNVARKIPEAQAQSDYLEQVCGDNTALLARVQALLRINEQRPNFLESAPSGVEPTMEMSQISERTGTIIGNYKLMEQIGEGGMGVVYVAQQERPMRRRVALKVIKPGMDTKEVISRFAAESQALALMDHPNIAKVHDAGTTDSGRPYFVMELVRGIPITEYCDLNRFNARERLELFIHVCQAVQHAHQKGIIHRDLKPPNVLITEHDGTPVVKVIDFGVAKAINQQLTERTIYTRHQQMVGTPMYMSPEQAELSGLDVDTRSDIYSLGVLLYELLTGTTPFDKARLSEAAYDEIRRIIREEEPSKPSTKIRTLGKTATSISGYRRTDPKKLSQLLRGDLDWIVMKSLEKDRNRRYDTAKGLANDIQRHLNDEPVVARPPSATYQFQKFARRNKTLLTSAVAVSLALVVGTGVATWKAIEANRARDVADTANNAAQINLERAREAEATQKTLAEQAQLLARRESAARKKEAAAREETRRLLYASDMTVAEQALREGGNVRIDEILKRHIPKKPDQEDYRNFEWYHLKWISRRRWKSMIDFEQPRFKVNHDNPGVVWAVPSPDEHVLAVVHPLGRVILYDATTYKRIDSFVTDETEWITYVTFSPDAKTLAYPDGTDIVLREVTSRATQRLPHSDQVFSLDFSPNGKFVAVLGENQQITVWSAETLEVHTVLSRTEKHPKSTSLGWPSRRVAFSPDSRLVASGHPDGSVILWDLNDDTPLRELRGHQLGIASIAFSHDGRLLAARTADEIRFWDIGRADEDEPITLTTGRTSSLRGSGIISMAFSEDDKTLASGYLDGTIELWDLATHTLRDTLRGHLYNVTALWFANEGATLVSASHDGSVRTWELEEDFRHDFLSTDGPILAIQFSPNGQEVAVHSRDGVQLWSPESGTVRLTPIQGNEAGDIAGHKIAFSHDWKAASVEKYGTVQVWDLSTGKPLERFQPVSPKGGMHVVLSEDGILVATYSRDGTVQIWDRSAPQKTLTDRCSFGWGVLSRLAFSPNRHFLAIGHSSGTVSIWDPVTLTLLRKKRLFKRTAALAFSPDGHTLAAASTHGEIAFWDCSNDEADATVFRGHSAACGALLFSSDGSRLYSGDLLGYLKSWDVTTRQEVYSFRHESRVYDISLSPDGKTLAGATFGWQGVPPMVRLWRAPDMPASVEGVQTR